MWVGWGGVGGYDQLFCPASPRLLLGLDLGLGCDNLFNEGIHVDTNCSNCNEHYTGIHRKTLTDVSKTQFIVLVCSRYLESIDGYELINNKVNSTGDVMLR